MSYFDWMGICPIKIHLTENLFLIWLFKAPKFHGIKHQLSSNCPKRLKIIVKTTERHSLHTEITINNGSSTTRLNTKKTTTTAMDELTNWVQYQQTSHRRLFPRLNNIYALTLAVFSKSLEISHFFHCLFAVFSTFHYRFHVDFDFILILCFSITHFQLCTFTRTVSTSWLVPLCVRKRKTKHL